MERAKKKIRGEREKEDKRREGSYLSLTLSVSVTMLSIFPRRALSWSMIHPE
jgi:hypothetical protein